jgi:hypothetical protein
MFSMIYAKSVSSATAKRAVPYFSPEIRRKMGELRAAAVVFRVDRGTGIFEDAGYELFWILVVVCPGVDAHGSG